MFSGPSKLSLENSGAPCCVRLEAIQHVFAVKYSTADTCWAESSEYCADTHQLLIKVGLRLGHIFVAHTCPPRALYAFVVLSLRHQRSDVKFHYVASLQAIFLYATQLLLCTTHLHFLAMLCYVQGIWNEHENIRHTSIFRYRGHRSKNTFDWNLLKVWPNVPRFSDTLWMTCVDWFQLSFNFWDKLINLA